MSSPPPPVVPDRAAPIMQVLAVQQTLLAELSPLAEQQEGLIKSGDTAGLLTLLSQRQGIIDRFLDTQSDLTRLTADLSRQPAPLPESSRRRLLDLAAEVDRHLSRIVALDGDDQTRLRAARDRTQEELTGLDAGRSAHRAYLRSRTVTSRFADRRG